MLEDLPMPALMMLIMGGLSIGGYVIIRLTNAYANRIGGERQSADLPSDSIDKLRQIQVTLDSLSLEVERISEAQRYTAKLLADAAGKPSAIPHAVPNHDVGTRK
jgi:hypothetical protein